MAGGFGRSDQGSLADRVAASGSRTSVSAGSEPDHFVDSPARHCFVGGEPALLVEWRRGRSGWEGRVISMVWMDLVGWATVERWLSVDQIESPSRKP